MCINQQWRYFTNSNLHIMNSNKDLNNYLHKEKYHSIQFLGICWLFCPINFNKYSWYGRWLISYKIMWWKMRWQKATTINQNKVVNTKRNRKIEIKAEWHSCMLVSPPYNWNCVKTSGLQVKALQKLLWNGDISFETL